MPDLNEMRKVDTEQYFKEKGLDPKDIFKDKIIEQNDYRGGFIPDKRTNSNDELVLRVELLETEILYLKHLMQHTFDGHVLIDGQFKKISV